MAITAETRTAIIELVVTAYNAAPGTTLLTELVEAVDAGASLADIATALTTSSTFNNIYPTFQTVEEFASEFLTNVVPMASAEARAEGMAVIASVLNSGGSRADVVLQASSFLSNLSEDDPALGTSAALFNNRVEVAEFYSVTQEQDADTLEELQAVLNGVDETDESVAQAIESLGGMFTLTENADRGDDFVGTGANNAFNAPISTVNFTNGNTLNSGDVLDGGAGVDTLDAELINDAFATGDTGAVRPTTEDIENVIVNAIETSGDGGFVGSTVVLNAANMLDVDNVWSRDSNANLVIQDITTKTSDGGVRNTEDLTFRMDHTSNENSGTSNQSDLTVYFDENYLLSEEETSGASLLIRMLNAVTNVEGNNPIQGFNSIVFAVGDTEVTVDVESIAEDATLDSSTAYAAVVDAINAQLVEDGFPDVTAAIQPLTESVFSIDVGGYGVGDSAGEYHPILVTNQGDEELTGIEFGQTRLEFDTDINNSFDPAPPATSDTPITTNLELFKAGRGDEGGDVHIGGKAGGLIEVINIDVLGAENKPSNIGSLSTGDGEGFETINIATHDDFVDGDSVASLTIRDVVGSPETIDAGDFLGDLNLGTSDTPVTVGTLDVSGGGDVVVFLDVSEGSTDVVTGDTGTVTITYFDGTDTNTVTIEEAGTTTIGDGDAGGGDPGDPGDPDLVIVDLSDGDATGVDGVAEAFVYEFEVIDGRATNSGDGEVNIVNFNPAEDILRFDDVTDTWSTDAEFLADDNGVVINENPFEDETNISFDADTGGTAGLLNLVGIQDGDLANTPFEVI